VARRDRSDWVDEMVLHLMDELSRQLTQLVLKC
jgi:hypothetical protein